MMTIDIKILNREIKEFLKKAKVMCNGDKELQHDIDGNLNHLELCYEFGDHLEPFEYTQVIENLHEIAEINNIDTYEQLLVDYPLIIELLSFYQRKVNRRNT